MHNHSLLLITLLLLSTTTGTSHARQITQRDLEPSVPEQGSPLASIGAGLGLGLVGFTAGALAAAEMAEGCSSHEFCQLEAAFYGAAAGGTFGMALGVHLGNMRRGNVAVDFVTGAAIWGAGIGIAAASGWDDTVTTVAFVMIPIVQLVSTVAVERAIGRSRLRGRRVSVSLVPRVDGGAMFVGRVVY